MPVHDVQMVVDGEAAAALAQRARERWEHASGRAVEPVAPRATVGRADVEPDFLEHVPSASSARSPALEDRGEDIREVERSTVAAIAVPSG